MGRTFNPIIVRFKLKKPTCRRWKFSTFNPIIVRFKPLRFCVKGGDTGDFQSYNSSIQTYIQELQNLVPGNFQSYNSSIQTWLTRKAASGSIGFQSYNSSIQTLGGSRG